MIKNIKIQSTNVAIGNKTSNQNRGAAGARSHSPPPPQRARAVNGVTLSRLIVPLATMLGRSGYEPFRWIDPRIDSELARLEPLEVKPVHGFELREERRKRRRERSLKGRGSGWQATLETFIRVEPSGAPG